MIANGQPIEAEDFVANPAPFFSIEQSSGTTHSLTTVANQKVVVMVKGDFTGSSDPETISVSYNGVQKDAVRVELSNSTFFSPFSLQYTEIPGAATHNITVEVTTGGIIANVKIIVMKLQVG